MVVLVVITKQDKTRQDGLNLTRQMFSASSATHNVTALHSYPTASFSSPAPVCPVFQAENQSSIVASTSNTNLYRIEGTTVNQVIALWLQGEGSNNSSENQFRHYYKGVFSKNLKLSFQ